MYWKYLKSLLRHKWFVLVECVRLGVPLLGILHDWSKFLPSEFIPYAQRFYGNTMRYDDDRILRAFALHYKRNAHHWQFWLFQGYQEDGWHIRGANGVYEIWRDAGDYARIAFKGSFQYNSQDFVLFALRQCQTPVPMPDRYRREMLADWIGAGKAYGKQEGNNNNPDTKQWYLDNKDKIILHPETRAWIEEQLGVDND